MKYYVFLLPRFCRAISLLLSFTSNFWNVQRQLSLVIILRRLKSFRKNFRSADEQMSLKLACWPD